MTETETDVDATEVLGVVGEGRRRVADLAADRGFETTAGDADAVLADSPDVVLALGESALYALVRRGATGPVVPVDADRRVRSTPRSAIDQTLSAVASGAFETVPLSTLSIDAGAKTYRALADAMLVTARPAKISEFAIHTPDRGGERATVDTVRADGVLVSSPAGGGGYADAADAPTLGPGLDGVAVTPIAPFRIEQTDWVLDYPVEVTIERRESRVTLLVDDRDVGLVDFDATVRVERGDPLTVVTTDESRPFFD